MFASSIDLNRLCSTYLLAGPSGIGKRVAARSCAKLILCHQRTGIESCGVCTSCSAFQHSQHPRFNERDFTLNKKSSDSVVDVVREFIEEVHRLGGDGRPLIFLIPNIQDYSVQVQNALLKTFEEPPAGVIFLLTADRPQELLETILSRSQLIHLSPLSLPELKQVMKKRKVDFEWSDLVLRMCEGRVDLAEQYSKESYLKLIHWVDQKLLKPEQDFIEIADQFMALARELELPTHDSEEDKEMSDRAVASEAIGVFERMFMQ